MQSEEPKPQGAHMERTGLGRCQDSINCNLGIKLGEVERAEEGPTGLRRKKALGRCVEARSTRSPSQNKTPAWGTEILLPTHIADPAL